ncbi:hypothetical protein [Selenomonas noxia]|uniref:hypothetical protein n=1 Tax=Selenomonas noxia TaxID=135083 RepID=UPI0028D0C327|nr:hypothetical protein [Selenomonas noxia]
MKRGIWIEIDDKELESIFKELDELRNKFYDCCDKLRLIPIVTVKKAPPDEATPCEKD